MKELLKEYFELQKQIYSFFGYQEDWVIIPLDDSTDCYWFVEQDEGGGGYVSFSEKPLTIKLIKEGENFYQEKIYTQRFLPKWVYRTDDYTMICTDTQTDGNKFLRIFDNTKELIDPSKEHIEAFEKWHYYK